MESIYLSIDLDFWLTDFNWYEKRQTRNMYSFLDSLPKIENKIMVDDHHGLLNHIEITNYDAIYHVDYHQDIAFPTRKEEKITLNCGTFFYFLSKRKEVSFKWFCPKANCYRKQCYGFCVDGANPMIKKNWIFKDQSVKVGVPDLSNVNIAGIGISISEAWCYCDKNVLVNVVDHLVKLGYEYNGNLKSTLEEFNREIYA